MELAESRSFLGTPREVAPGAFQCSCPPRAVQCVLQKTAAAEGHCPECPIDLVPSRRLRFESRRTSSSLRESQAAPSSGLLPVASRHRRGGLSRGRRARGPALWALRRSHHQQAQGPKHVPPSLPGSSASRLH